MKFKEGCLGIPYRGTNWWVSTNGQLDVSSATWLLKNSYAENVLHFDHLKIQLKENIFQAKQE